MRILIIEDEPLAAERLKVLLRNAEPESEIIGVLDSVESGLEWFQADNNPDLILSDIHIADGNSFEIFEQAGVKAPVIFTTAYDQYAIEAFNHNSIDYLLKPIDEGDLAKALNKFREHRFATPTLNRQTINSILNRLNKNYKSRFVVKHGERLFSLKAEEIEVFFSEDRYTLLAGPDGRKFIINHTIEQLVAQLDPQKFFRINRKYIVNISAIDEILSYSSSRLVVRLKNYSADDVIVSRDRVKTFKEWLEG